jgi:hypothetical protein
MIDLQDLSRCLNRLQEIFGDYQVSIEWLNFPHPSLGRTPMTALAEGDAESVIKILEKMKNANLS